MWGKIVIIVALIYFTACRNTQEYSKSGNHLQSYVDCSYMGAFSSVSVIKDKWTSNFNDTLTSYANYVYDSVIKSKIRYVKPVNITAAIPNESAVELTKQITHCAKKFETTNRLDSLYLASMVDSVSNLANTRYTDRK